MILRIPNQGNSSQAPDKSELPKRMKVESERDINKESLAIKPLRKGENFLSN